MVRRLSFIAHARVLALSLLVVAPAAWGQPGVFEIMLNGGQVGTASCKIVATTHGYSSTTVMHVTTHGLDYSLSKTEQLSPSHQFEHVLLSAVVNNEAVSVTGSLASAKIVLHISANGHTVTTPLTAHAGAVFMPDFDPGAFETLLALAAERNNRGLWAIIPKQSGAIAPIQLATYEDQQGTLNGKTITVHHLVATIGGSQANIYSSADNQLMQANLPQQGFVLVYKGFALKPLSGAAAAPAN